jgi:hypothetical protein
MKYCFHCKSQVTPETDHRKCVLDLFKANAIQSVAEWNARCTDIKQRVVIRVKKEELTTQPGTPV